MENGGQAIQLSAALDEYKQNVDAWLNAAKKHTAAVNRLQKAVVAGNVRDVEKLRQNARDAAEASVETARSCGAFDFEISDYLRDGYLDELKEAAQDAGVQLFEREGVVFCYPVLVRLAPDSKAVRIDKKLEPNIRPSVLAGVLKKAQSREPKANPQRFIDTLFKAYHLLKAENGLDNDADLLLKDIYRILTLLPGSGSEYTLLDFTRDLYFLDTAGVTTTKSGARLSWANSTISRESSKNILTFVTRDGNEKSYAAIKFSV